MIRPRFLLVLSVAALALVACSSPGGSGSTDATSSPAGDSELVATGDLAIAGSWRLTSNPAITLEITAEGEASGSGGCNTYRTSIGQDPATGNLVVGPAISTRMACEQSVMDAETAYLTSLEAVVSGEAGDVALTLETVDGDTLVFEAA